MIYLFMNNGGMGNQMFQYAIARRLQIEYDMEIVCDLSKFEYKKSNATKREYCLNEFNLTDRITYKNLFLSKIYYKLFKKIISFRTKEPSENYKRLTRFGLYSPQGYYNYFPDEKTEALNLYINGLFQDHQYFDTILPILRKDFSLSSPPSSEIENILETVKNEESVCVHWRRGDYLAEQYRDALLVCDEIYYYRAIEKIRKKVKNPSLFIFTNTIEDAEWIERNYHFDFPVHYVNKMIKEQHSDIDDFRIMCACKHFIISNSTYSWWAQHLSSNDTKIVIAPSIWNRKENAIDLYLDNWEVIPV